MRALITGVKDGKSCVLEEIDCLAEGETMSVFPLFRSPLAELPSRPDCGRATVFDLGVPPGVIRWLNVWFPPGKFIENHSSDTFECLTIVSGSAELILETGTHQIRAGDRILIPGIDHAWRTGPEGCNASITAIAVPPP